MEITYLREQGICCVQYKLYIEKLAKLFLRAGNGRCMSYPTIPMEASVYDKLTLAQQEANFEGPYRSIVGAFIYFCLHKDGYWFCHLHFNTTARKFHTFSFFDGKKSFKVPHWNQEFWIDFGWGSNSQSFCFFLMQISPTIKLTGKA